MNTIPAATISTLTLFCFYAVSFTKFLFDGIGQPRKQKDGTMSAGNPSLSNGIVRLWALVLGLAGAIVSYLMTSASYNRVGLYDQVLLGASAAVLAVITYHIGSLFKGAFDTADGTTTTVTVKEPASQPAIPQPAQVSVSQTTQPPPLVETPPSALPPAAV